MMKRSMFMRSEFVRHELGWWWWRSIDDGRSDDVDHPTMIFRRLDSVRGFVVESKELTDGRAVNVSGEESNSDLALKSELLTSEEKLVSFVFVMFVTPVVVLWKIFKISLRLHVRRGNRPHQIIQ